MIAPDIRIRLESSPERNARPESMAQSIRTSRKLLEAAKQTAADTLTSARSRAHEITSEAHTSGFRSGRERAISELLSGSKLYRSAVQAAQEEITEVVIRVCEEVLAGELKTCRHGISNRVVRAIQQLQLRGSTKIRVHSEDYPTLEHSLALLQQKFPETCSIEVALSGEIQRGTAQLETALGSITASPWEHLRGITKSLSALSGRDFLKLFPMLGKKLQTLDSKQHAVNISGVRK